MNYIELDVSVTPSDIGSDVLITLLSEIGFDSFETNQAGFKAFIPQPEFNKTIIDELINQYRETFKIEYKINEIKQQNWNALWESSFQPVNINNQCFIRAPFHPKPDNIKYDIIIEPKMSFGTGHHDTTRLMVEKILSLDIKNKSLLDVGCGTGVLAILGYMAGANPVEAIDIDDWCYENTIENIARNNVKNLAVYKGNIQLLHNKSFHTILANINKNVLLSEMHNYSQLLEKNGNLIMSGFFKTDMDEINNFAEKNSLSLINSNTINQWAITHFVKL